MSGLTVLVGCEASIGAGCYMVFLDLTWHCSCSLLVPCPPKACRDLFEQRVCSERNLLTHSSPMLELRRVSCLNLQKLGREFVWLHWVVAGWELWWWVGWRWCCLEESSFGWCFGSVGMATPGILKVNWVTWAQSTKCNVLTPLLVWFTHVQ